MIRSSSRRSSTAMRPRHGSSSIVLPRNLLAHERRSWLMADARSTRDLLDYLSSELGQEVTSVRKFGRQSAQWDLVIANDGAEVSIPLGRSADVLSPKKVATAIFDSTGQVVRHRGDWH